MSTDWLTDDARHWIKTDVKERLYFTWSHFTSSHLNWTELASRPCTVRRVGLVQMIRVKWTGGFVPFRPVSSTCSGARTSRGRLADSSSLLDCDWAVERLQRLTGCADAAASRERESEWVTRWLSSVWRTRLMHLMRCDGRADQATPPIHRHDRCLPTTVTVPYVPSENKTP